MPRRAPARPPADPDAFPQAIRWFRSRLIMSDEEFAALEDASYERAFTVAGVAQLDLVTEVWEALDRAIAQGETFGDFQGAVADKLAAAWGGEQPWRVETIFRTNVQSAYSAGRWQQMQAPAVMAARPFRRYSAIFDQRECPICAELDGAVRPADDAWWRTHNPPMHFNCRCHVVTLSKAEAEAEGVDPSGPSVDAAEGFGGAPSETDDWQPDLSEYPGPLVRIWAEG